jgi:Flp pilus assembly protein TadG
MKRIFRLIRATNAAEIAELAVVLPILFTMIFAIFSFGRAYNVYSTVTRAAEEGARVAVTPVCATCGSQFPSDATVAAAVLDVISASHLNPGPTTITPGPDFTNDGCLAPAPSTHSCAPDPSNIIKICRNVVLNPTSSPPACGTVVSFKYRYVLLPIPFSTLQSIDIPATAQMRMEY